MKEIAREHPEYRERARAWRRARHLYQGGWALKAAASEYLLRRQKEPMEVYQERLNQVYYENYVGSIVDWYLSSLFRREPLYLTTGDDAAGRRFINGFVENCDRKGTPLVEFFRGLARDGMLFGAAHVLVDFPRAKQAARTRAEEEASGVNRAYLVPCAPEQLINWSLDDSGEYEWAVIRRSRIVSESFSADQLTRETVWYWYGRETFRAFRQVQRGEGEAGPVVLADEGRHGLADTGRVPLLTLEAPEGMRLMERAADLQVEHFNKSNALSWALAMGLYASPVVYSDREWNQIVGDSYYIQLGPEDRFGWTEPEGKVYQIAADNLARLKDEIYRVCHLLSHAGMPASGGPQSGWSKQRDFLMTQEVLRALGDWVKGGMKLVLDRVIEARKDGVQVDVAGLDEFDIGDFSSEVGDVERLLQLGIPSTTFQKQVQKRLALKYLCDLRQDVKDRIAAEIEEG